MDTDVADQPFDRLHYLMITVVLVIHLLIAMALVGVILLQRSEGGALGIGGNAGFVSGRAAGNILTRATALLAVAFFSTSMILAVLAGGNRADSILDAPGQPASAPSGQASGEPSVPLPE